MVDPLVHRCNAMQCHAMQCNAKKCNEAHVLLRGRFGLVDPVVHRCRRWLSAVPAIEQDPAELPKTRLPIVAKDPAELPTILHRRTSTGPVGLCGRIVLLEWYSLYLPVHVGESLNLASKRQGCVSSLEINK